MTRGCLLLATLGLFMLALLPVAGSAEGLQAQILSDPTNSLLAGRSYASDSIIIAKASAQRTYVPPTAVAKRPGHYTIADWRSVIDSTWGWGLTKTQKLAIFDAYWNTIDSAFACFNNIEVNWDSLGTLYRDEIVNGDPTYGVSRGRFAAIMNRMGLSLKESHTYADDIVVNWNTALAPGIPLMVIGSFGYANGHFGAGLTPLPDSSLLIYRVHPLNPLRLVPGDIVLGYDRLPWKRLYHEMLDAGLPMAYNFWGSCPSAMEHSFLMAAGMNWHLFDSIDVVKYSTGDTMHLSVAPLIGQNMVLPCTEQMDIPGVPIPDFTNGEWVTYGIVEGTQIGYIYALSWSSETVRIQFNAAVRNLLENYNTTGLIIDFRMNFGGMPIYGNDGMSYLFNAEEYTEDFASRVSRQDHFALRASGILGSCQVAGRASPIYDKPVAVLTGPGAYSAGDMNALKFKYLPTARFFGKSTSTAFNCPLSISVSGEWSLHYANWNAYLATEVGQYLTHREQPVDESIWLTRDGVAAGRDDVVEAAMAWINSVQPNEPAKSYAPSSVAISVRRGESAETSLVIQNSGNWPLMYSLTPESEGLRLDNSEIPDSSGIAGHGGFDQSGYMWIDSDQPHGPNYNWIDITSTGSRIYLYDNNYLGPFGLGFDFPFYGQTYNQIYVGSNGLLTFGSGSTDPTNDPIPSLQGPNNVIAPYWTNLNCTGRAVYYYADSVNQRFIISFNGVPHSGPTGYMAFQAVLYPDGRIDFNYGRMIAGTIWWTDWLAGTFSFPGTIGIENANGTDGLQIAYYENYLHDSLSISIYPSWLAVAPASGHIDPGSSTTATVSFRAGNLPPGTYTGNVYLESNDPNVPSDTIPVSMEVLAPTCNYIVGDANGNQSFNGLDVVYSVSYFKGGPPPPYSCECTPGQTWYVAGDVNASCNFNGLDVSYMVTYLKGGPPPVPCADCPPGR